MPHFKITYLMSMLTVLIHLASAILQIYFIILERIITNFAQSTLKRIYTVPNASKECLTFRF